MQGETSVREDEMTVIHGLLFDKDGTLFDFSASWMAVVDQTLMVLGRTPEERLQMAQDVGYDLPARRFMPGSVIVAGAVDESARIWALRRPDLGALRIEDVANRIVDEAVSAGALAPAVPDLRGLLQTLVRDGYVLGIGTHDSEAAARDQIARFDLSESFSFIAGYDSGHGLKPGPGMMHAFCASTALKPEHCVMIGDSVHDLGVAESSGAAMAVGVLTGPATRQDLLDHADHILPSIGDLPELLRRLREG